MPPKRSGNLRCYCQESTVELGFERGFPLGKFHTGVRSWMRPAYHPCHSSPLCTGHRRCGSTVGVQRLVTVEHEFGGDKFALFFAQGLQREIADEGTSLFHFAIGHQDGDIDGAMAWEGLPPVDFHLCEQI